jgi:type IV pilus assembly protein PilB
MSTPNPNDPKKPVNPPSATGKPPASAGATPPKVNPPASGVPKVNPPVSGAPKVPASGAPKVNPPTSVGGSPKVPASGAVKPPAPKPKPAPAPKPKAKHLHIDSTSKQLGQKLVDLGYLDDFQLEDIYNELSSGDQKLGEALVEKGVINDDQLLQALAEVHGMKLMPLDDVKPTPEALKIVPKNMAELYKMVPLSFEGGALTVVMSDPNNLQAIDDIKNFLSIGNVNAVLAQPSAVAALMEKAYKTGAGGEGAEESMMSIIKSFENDPDFAPGMNKRETSIDLNSLEEMANSAPVRKLINMVLLIAIRDHASDIHFEPFEEEYKMRYKCDGVLYEMVPPPRHMGTAIASRIKVMSNLDIAERRMPQDGRIELNVGGNRIDMRVSVLPTLFGESVVIRVLDKSSVGLSLDRIGMPPKILAQFRQVIKKPNGIVLVTGPTGSGKTTTLYSALSELNDIDTKLITTEDPVEYEIDGIVQCPIQSEIDLTFAAALRAILRQDPDIILVGEVRDLETAQIAIQASLTGHLVFSTLHTNDAPSSITRLRDMGVEPFLITATVEAIQAQRLVRKVCQNCRTPYEPTRDQVMELNMPFEDFKGKKFYYGEGCDKCNNLGFKGRTGLYELLIMNDDLRDMVSRGASTDQVRAYSRKMGVTSLRDCGLEALLNGTSTLDEVARETVTED